MIYQPSHRLSSRIARKLTRFQSVNKMRLAPGKTVVSFSFDDCPKSAIRGGVRALEAEGWRSTIYVACGLLGTENHHGEILAGEDVRALQDNGHEIGDHTFSHLDASKSTLPDFEQDVERNQEALSALGVSPSRTFAYPYGVATPDTKAAMQRRFKGARGIDMTLHCKSVDLNQIGSFPIYENSSADTIGAIRAIAKSGGWITLFTHDIRDNPSEWGCTPKTMQSIIEAIKDVGADILTIEGAIQAFGEAA
ncbi:MAG: polysaccharide deacetylase family protein [Hellea sp.]|nr:polysaccharide deacetylase family protein [Hellea sp.]